MTSNSKTTDEQIAQELNDIDDRLKAAEQYAGKALKHEEAFWSRVYQALHDIYAVWQPLLNAEHLIEAYCKRHGMDPNKVKRENRFYAPIQHCFRNARSATSVTHYADTLKEADRIGKTPDELVEWVKKHDGPDGVYAIVAARRKAAKAAQAAASHPPVTAPQPTVQQPQPQTGTPLAVAQQPPSTQTASVTAPAAPGQPINTIGRVVDAIRTVDQLVNGKERRVSDQDDRAILIRNVLSEGRNTLCVENADSRQTFTTARVILPFAWDEIGSREYLLSQREAERLTRTIGQSNNWRVDARVDELEFQSDKGHRIPASALSDMDQVHRHMAAPSGHGSHLKLTSARAREFLKWFDAVVRSIRTQAAHHRSEAHEQINRHQDILTNLWQQRRTVMVGQRTTMHVPASNRLLDHRSFDYVLPGKVNMPRALDLVPNQRWVQRKDIDPTASGKDGEEMVGIDVLEVNLFRTYHLPFPTWANNTKCQPFEAAKKVSIGEDVRLPTIELETLCKLLARSGNDANVQFVNTDETQAALLAEFAHGGEQVRYMIPTVKSASLLRRQACQPLVRTVPVV